MSYNVLYNEYRPEYLSQVVGQQHIVKLLQSQIEQDKLPHSLIFYGPSGVGKTTVARILAKVYNSHDSGTEEIDASVDRKVDTIRNLIPTFNYSSLEGDYKTIIFDEAHQITHDAFQALQKVVEEPPTGIRFIFVTTRIDKIPTTIIGRSQRHQFTLLDKGDIHNRIKSILEDQESTLSENIIEAVSRYSNGSLRDALVGLDQAITLKNSAGDKDLEKSVFEVLGLIGSSQLSHFLTLVLKRSKVKTLMESFSAFGLNNLDFRTIVYDLQQYLIDSLAYLMDPSVESFLKFNVSSFISEIESSASKKGVALDYVRKALAEDLNKIYKFTLEFEEVLNKTYNVQSATRYFVLKLSTILS